jgi:tetratricopeptide (TPR) repeat protein
MSTNAAAAPPPAATRPGRITLPEATTVLAGVIAVGIVIVWGWRGAGYAATTWLPGALVLLALLVSVLVGGRGAPRRLRRLSTVALAALGLYTVWTYASVGWAADKGDAWDGANRSLLYLTVYALFLVLPWTVRSGTLVLGVYAAGICALAVTAIARALRTADVDLFIQGRFSFPTEYPNANALLLLSGFWVALGFATRREPAAPLRAAATAAVVFLPQAALLSQSRGSLAAFPLTALLVVALVPGRVRTAAGLLLAVAALAVTWDTHLRVYRVAEDGGTELRHALEPSVIAMSLTTAAAALLGLGWAVIDGRVEFSAQVQRRLRLGAAGAAVAMVAASAVLLVPAHPVDRLNRAWDDFTAVTTDEEWLAQQRASSHFAVGVSGSNRYDFWRVAFADFRERPLAGMGADNFAASYLRERRSGEEPRYPHSLELRLLSQLGIVGAALFVVFAGAATAAALRAREPQARLLLIGGLGIWLYWLIHGSADWFWELPALSAPAFAFVALLAALPAETASGTGGRRAPVLALAALVLAGVVAAGSYAAPLLAARDVEHAIDRWPDDPGETYDRLDRARALNPLSEEPDLVAGAIAARLDDRARMRRSFQRAVERNPDSWYAWLELALTESVEGRPRAARRLLQRAVTLNPTDPVLADVRARLARGERVHPRSLDAVFAERIDARTR